MSNQKSLNYTYDSFLYSYISKTSLKNPSFEITKSLWLYSIHAFLLERINFKLLCEIADEIYYVLNDGKNAYKNSRFSHFSSEMSVLADYEGLDVDDELINKFKVSLEKRFNENVDAALRIDFKKVLSSIPQTVTKESTTMTLQKSLDDYKKNLLTLGEISSIAMGILEQYKKEKDNSLYESNTEIYTNLNRLAAIVPDVLYTPSVTDDKMIYLKKVTS